LAESNKAKKLEQLPASCQSIFNIAL